MVQTNAQSCGWYGSFESFLSISEADWLTSLSSHHLGCMNEPPAASQLAAWQNCFKVLQSQLPLLVHERPEASLWTIIFEYELPRERGRRPDVVILAGSTILVLEFKDFSVPMQAHIDQVSAYGRDLEHYHAGSHHHRLHPLLVLTKAKGLATNQEGVCVVSPDGLPTVLSYLAHSNGQPIDPFAWLNADYAPLPSLISAARTIFQHEALPQIRRAHSAGIPETIAELVTIGKQAQANNQLHLALVTGVPGAGKTLVGLQFVYTNYFDDPEGGRTAVFLSGNGPLVKVLQHALKSSVFVQDVHGFLKQYGGNQTRQPEEHIWVYDEAQRAWDAGRVSEKRGHGASEPEDFLRLGERMDSWALMVGLIGEGQEIHLGEEAGLGQWNDAIGAMTRPWIVHCPNKVASLFTAASKVYSNARLDLTTSLRSHIAEDVQLWVKQLLDGQLGSAASTSKPIMDQGFDMYVSRDIAVAERYVRERYQGQEDKRYGLLASSKARNLSKFGVPNEYNFTKNLREGPWYNDPPDSRLSCCQLHDVATEFACQGLELDFPIVAWGNDLTWKDRQWHSLPQLRSKAHDPHQLRINSYRVLLSRGRDGFVIFVPKDTEMDRTYTALLNSGLRVLD
jgi:hypothetical protein